MARHRGKAVQIMAGVRGSSCYAVVVMSSSLTLDMFIVVVVYGLDLKLDLKSRSDMHSPSTPKP